MKLHIIKLAVLFIGLLSCNDSQEYRKFQWDSSTQQEEFKPINPGTESSSFAIDSNMISFAVPHLVGTMVYERLPEPGYGGPNAFSPHYWRIHLIMAEGTDITSLAPTITLAPGATITWIHNESARSSEQVDYTGITEVGVYNFRHQVYFDVITPDGSMVTYKFLAFVISE